MRFAALLLAAIGTLAAAPDGITEADVVKTIEHMRAIVQEQTRQLDDSALRLEVATHQLADTDARAGELQIVVDAQAAQLDAAKRDLEKATAKYRRLKLWVCLITAGAVFSLLSALGVTRISFPYGALIAATAAAIASGAVAFYF